jgi:phage recombination protein Bet
MSLITIPTFEQKQIDILKNTICKGVSNDEFEIFLMACKKTGLDPFMKQIHAVKRKSKNSNGEWVETMTIQTGIDGYRLIAERTGRYAPGKQPTYNYDDKGKITSATAYVKKQTTDGTWHEVAAEAFFKEYCPLTKEGKPTKFWNDMPHGQIAKCAEALALRKAFPAEMSGIYTQEEMAQAENQKLVVEPFEEKPVPFLVKKISPEQLYDLQMILEECSPEYVEKVFNLALKKYKIENLCDMPLEKYENALNSAKADREAYIKKQAEEYKDQELIATEVQ